MAFTRSSRHVSLGPDFILKADCRTCKGAFQPSFVDLKGFVGNVNGNLQFDNHSFHQSSRFAIVETRGDASFLVAECRTVAGNWQRSQLRLDDRISNQDGVLRYTGSPPAVPAPYPIPYQPPPAPYQPVYQTPPASYQPYQPPPVPFQPPQAPYYPPPPNYGMFPSGRVVTFENPHDHIRQDGTAVKGCLGVTPEGKLIVKGGHGPWTKWTVINHGDGTISFQNPHAHIRQEGTGVPGCLGVNPDGNLLVNAGNGPWGRWRVLDNGDGTVVLENPHEHIRQEGTMAKGCLGVTPEGVLISRAGHGPWGRWRFF